MDLSAYKNYDPNEIYKDGSVTFVYTRSGELWTDRFPQNHIDLILKNDEIFYDVFDDPMYVDLDEDEKLKLAKERSEQTRHAIVGRFGYEHGDFIVAVWNRLDHPLFKPFIKTLINNYPQFKDESISVIIIGREQQPKLLADLIKEEPKKKELKFGLVGFRDRLKTTVAPMSPRQAKEMPDNKAFKIDGQYYSLKDFADLRKAAHSQSWRWGEIRGILCHPDMKNYPELEPYIPPKCLPYQMKKSPRWSDWLRAMGPHYSYESNQKLYFKGWLLSEGDRCGTKRICVSR